jgi:DnaJ-class molecular chaperone
MTSASKCRHCGHSDWSWLVRTGETKEISCSFCAGKGTRSPFACENCKGTGTTPGRRYDGRLGTDFPVLVTCEKCNGEGKVPGKSCAFCSGTGKAMVREIRDTIHNESYWEPTKEF